MDVFCAPGTAAPAALSVPTLSMYAMRSAGNLAMRKSTENASHRSAGLSLAFFSPYTCDATMCLHHRRSAHSAVSLRLLSQGAEAHSKSLCATEHPQCRSTMLVP
jgi:hypothetical protein